MQPNLKRRDLLSALTASALAAPLASCFGAISDSAAREASQPTGPGTYGDARLPTHFASYADLARLPYFEDSSGSSTAAASCTERTGRSIRWRPRWPRSSWSPSTTGACGA